MMEGQQLIDEVTHRESTLRTLVTIHDLATALSALTEAHAEGERLEAQLAARRDQALEEMAAIATASRMLTSYSRFSTPGR